MTHSHSELESVDVSHVKGINHVGLSVSDLEASLQFYSKSIELEVDRNLIVSNSTAEKHSGFNASAVARATLRAPNTFIQLSQFNTSAFHPEEFIPVKGPGITHVCYQSLRTEDIFGNFVSQGASSVSRGVEPINLLGQGVYYAYARDRDGIMFEVEHLDRSPFESSVWFAHVALVSHDIDRLVDFYAILLGKPPARRSDHVAGSSFDEVADYDDVKIRAAWFELSNMILEFWQFINPITPKAEHRPAYESIGYNKVAFEVSDIHSDYHRLSELGVPFLTAPVKGDQSTEVYGRDPDGNLFSLIQPHTSSSISIDHLKKKNW